GSPDILSWKNRLKIGYDTAQGLEYMHHGCKSPIVHRDVKCSNILLNENLQAKLADFGLSRAFTNESATHVTTVVAGTPGYLDPEKLVIWINDIVVLPEDLLVYIYDEFCFLVKWVKSMIAEGNVESIIDPRLQGDYDINTAWKLVELAITCVDNISVKRPTMNDVVTDLKSCLKEDEGFHGAKPNKLDGHIALSLENMRPNLR
ncbi:leucine-rich repeat transmembrane protein kinase protein, partial [Tanacetum coccineum]